jgi:hypothetical protein
MRTTIFFIFVLFISKSIFGQELIGRYDDGIDYIDFGDSSVIYSIGSNERLIIMLIGYGKFCIVDKYLAIHH